MLAEVLRQTGTIEQLVSAPAPTQLAYPGLRELIERRMPLMFVAPDLLAAVKDTDYQDDIDWMELHLPYEHGIFVLPRGGLTHPVDGDVAFLYYSRMPAGTYPGPTNVHCPIRKTEDNFAFLASCPTSPTLAWFDTNLTRHNGRTLTKCRNMFYDSGYIEREAVCPFDQGLNDVDKTFQEAIGAVVFGLLLVLEARPELTGRESLAKRIPATMKHPVREFWHPNIIGSTYRRKVLAGAVETHGTHASPRAHSRRGHFRQQAHGPKNTLRKTLWIEPMFIGFKSEVNG
jgi:hypothetical protein